MSGKESESIKNMFNEISPRYVLMNRIMTFGRDSSWRKFVVEKADLRDGESFLDAATGTGDIILELLKTGVKPSRITGIDFSPGMLAAAGKRLNHAGPAVELREEDALAMSFRGGEFDVAVSAYLVRNVSDIHKAFAEQHRVLKPGGRIVCLDTTPPSSGIAAPFVKFYLLRIIPLLGALITGSRSAYTYLPESTKNFRPAEDVKKIMEQAGFEKVSYRKFMFGTMAVHWGVKPADHSGSPEK